MHRANGHDRPDLRPPAGRLAQYHDAVSDLVEQLDRAIDTAFLAGLQGGRYDLSFLRHAAAWAGYRRGYFRTVGEALNFFGEA